MSGRKKRDRLFHEKSPQKTSDEAEVNFSPVKSKILNCVRLIFQKTQFILSERFLSFNIPILGGTV